MNPRKLSFVFILLIPVFLSSCQNLADENEELREQISSLQEELVEVKTDKKVLEERLTKIEAALPPELRSTLDLSGDSNLKEEGLKVLEGITERIPSRKEIMQYLDRNIASLVAENPREGNAWRVTKISFIPPDIAYVDYTDSVVNRRILLQYSLDQETGINTKELALYHSQDGDYKLVSGKDVDHGGSMIVYVYDSDKGSFVSESNSLPKDSGSMTDETKLKEHEMKDADEDENMDLKEPIDEDNMSSEADHAAVTLPSGYRQYENSWHNYSISYPENWYFWGMGQVSGVMFRTGFSPGEVIQGQEAVVVDIKSGDSMDACASEIGGSQTRERVASKSAIKIDKAEKTYYVFEKEEGVCLIVSAQNKYKEILDEMASSLNFSK